MYELEIKGKYGALARYLVSKSNAVIEGTTGAIERPAHALFKGDLNELNEELEKTKHKTELNQLKSFADEQGIIKSQIQILIVE